MLFFSSNPGAATEFALPMLSEMACFCFPQVSIAGAAEVRPIPSYQRRLRGHPHTQSAFGFASLPLFALSFDGAKPYLWFFTTSKSFSNVVNSLEKKFDETDKRYEASSRIGEERLKRALDAESKAIQLRTAMQR